MAGEYSPRLLQYCMLWLDIALSSCCVVVAARKPALQQLCELLMHNIVRETRMCSSSPQLPAGACRYLQVHKLCHG